MEKLHSFLFFLTITLPTTTNTTTTKIKNNNNTEGKLKCWQCESEKNWNSCDDFNSVNCMGDQNRCAFIELKQGTVETFVRDCVPESFCEKKPPCKDKKLKTCKIKCCDKDECNSGKPEFVDN